MDIKSNLRYYLKFSCSKYILFEAFLSKQYSSLPFFVLYADTHLIKLLLYPYKTNGDHAFFHFGPSVWNTLPPHIRNAATITTFKSNLKTHFFSLYHSD